jgi:hypothetical protein
VLQIKRNIIRLLGSRKLEVVVEMPQLVSLALSSAYTTTVSNLEPTNILDVDLSGAAWNATLFYLDHCRAFILLPTFLPSARPTLLSSLVCMPPKKRE